MFRSVLTHICRAYHNRKNPTIHTESKTLFVVPTDAHYYKITEMLKQFKIITLAPTCFGSRKNHHQGAVLCLDKTTECCQNSYCVYTDEHRKTILCSFS